MQKVSKFQSFTSYFECRIESDEMNIIECKARRGSDKLYYGEGIVTV